MKVIWGTIYGTLGYLFGAALPYLTIMFVLILIDTVFGMINARKNGGITSRGFSALFKKIVIYIGSIITVNLIVGCLALPPTFLIVLVYALIGCEGLSILENARISGYLPPAACKILERITGAIKDRNDE